MNPNPESDISAATEAERAVLSRVTLASLKGAESAQAEVVASLSARASSTGGRGDPVAALEERAAAGDPNAQRELVLRRRVEDVPRRVARALAIEALDVVLADGSSLALDEAERLLANKEDQRVHTALRRSVDEAQASLRHFTRYGSDPATRNLAKAFLVDTAPLSAAALEALAALGGAPMEDAGSLARGLDLPDAQGAFGDDATRALVTGLRGAVRIAPTAVRVPRAMAGASFDGRYAWPTGLRRCDRHMRTLEALGTATATGVAAQRVGQGAAPAASAELGAAVALALSSPPVRQASGLDRRHAERAARICAATFVLRARASISLAALAEDAHVDEAREAVISALGIDPGRALLSTLAEPSWCSVDDEHPRAFMHAPVHALTMRDAFDETWPIRREAWDAIEHGDIVQRVDVDAKDAPARLAAAWKTWALELL